jgi:hypothetical protein
MNSYALAHQLGKPLEEIKAMKMEEFTMWQAYFCLITAKEKDNG